jgi:DNA polymerase III sliding clamp (beta) subunit (PCNA family)
MATVTIKHGKAVLTQALTCVSKDDSRPALTGVHIFTTATSTIVESADGFRLIRLTTTRIGDDDFDQIVAADAIKAAIKAAGHEPITINGKIETNGATFDYEQIAASFPDIERLTPDNDGDPSRFAINGRYLKDFGALARFADNGILRVRPGVSPSSPIRFDWCGDWGEAVGISMPMFAEWK